MFKKAVISDEISQDFAIAVQLACKYGLDGIEIRSVWEKGPHELDKQDIAVIKRILRESGLQVSAVSSPFYKCDMDNMAEIQEHLEILKRCMELAHELGTSLIRGFTFWRKGSFEDNLSKIVSRFEKPVEMLRAEALTLALEFDPSTSATNAGKLVKVLKSVDSPQVRALWDPGNDIYDPDHEIPYPDGYEIIKPFMVHMHLKDAAKQPDGKILAMPVGEGQVDYETQFKELEASGYKGYVVLETHFRPKHDISGDLLALPKGSAFSYGGYEATEDSLKKWFVIMDTIQGS
jgi:L-ribulose-5-phosphate 3-epimerase